MINCQHCQKEVIDELFYMRWLEIMHFLMFLELEGQITPATAKYLDNLMMHLKIEAYSEDQLDSLEKDLDTQSGQE